jgi:hypothetical protein
MARHRSRTPITDARRVTAAKRALASKVAMKRALTSASADEPVSKRPRVRGSRSRYHSWTKYCHLRCRRRGPPCRPKDSPSVASVALLADNKASEKLGEVQDAAVEQSRLVIVYDIAYVAEDGTMMEFTIEGPNVDGQPAGRTMEYLGAIDGAEVVPLYNRRGGPLPVQSEHADGFMLIDDDELAPHVGQHVYGRWLESTSGFAPGFYRGVVAVREQP